jgi:hypothetical protein
MVDRIREEVESTKDELDDLQREEHSPTFIGVDMVSHDGDGSSHHEDDVDEQGNPIGNVIERQEVEDDPIG